MPLQRKRELFNFLIDALAEGDLEYRQKAVQQFGISRKQVAYYASKVSKLLRERFSGGREEELLLICNKLYAFVRNLEEQGELEAAAKMLDRIVKLKGYNQPETAIQINEYKCAFQED